MSTSTTVESPAYTPFIESDANADAAELRGRMEEKGYLFFRGLIPEEPILKLRREILELCREAGWLDEGHDLMEAVLAPHVKPLAEGMPEYTAVYRKVLQLPGFRDFPYQDAQMNIGRKLVGDDVLVHARRIGRLNFPSYAFDPTPPHQDYFYIRGTTQTYSCWVPLGECPMSLGSLAVLPGSHQEGFKAHTANNPKAVVAVGVPVDESKAEWHTSDFSLGDALFFHSYTIHKALPNQTRDRLRLSTDNRYQLNGDEIAPGSMEPHLPVRA